MKKQYKAVVCDMDGTLLNGEHKISARTKSIIQHILSQGVKVFLASGRPYADIEFFKKQLGLDSYIISSNGAVVHNEKGEEIVSYEMESEILQELLALPHGTLHRNVYADNSWFVEIHVQELLDFHAESGFAFQVVKDLGALQKVNKVFFLEYNEQVIENFEKLLEEKMGDRVSLTLSTPNCLEVMKKGVNKGHALEDTMKKLGISLDEVIAFGDGLNDLEMLSVVGKGFVMGNASPRLLEALPNHDRAPHNTEDGVAQILEKIFL